MELKVGMKVRVNKSFGVSEHNVGRVATLLCVTDSRYVKYRYDDNTLSYWCPIEYVDTRFTPIRVTAPEFGPVPESGVTAIQDINQMLPFQVYQFRLVEEDGRADGKVRYIMATGVQGIYWHNAPWVDRWSTEGRRMEDGCLMGVNIVGLLSNGKYELVPLYDYPAMPTNMRHSHTSLMESYYAD